MAVRNIFPRVLCAIALLGAGQAIAFEKLGPASGPVAPFDLTAPAPGTMYLISNGENERVWTFKGQDGAQIKWKSGNCVSTFFLPMGMFVESSCRDTPPVEFKETTAPMPTSIDETFGKFKLRFDGTTGQGRRNNLKYNFTYRGTHRIRVPAGEFDVHQLDVQHMRLRMQFYFSPEVPGRPVARMRDGTTVLEELVKIP